MKNRQKLPGLIYDLRENIARLNCGDWSHEITEIINEPSDERFEGHIAFLRAARGFSGVGEGSLDRNSKNRSGLMYRLFFAQSIFFFGFTLGLLLLFNNLCRFVKTSVNRVAHVHRE
jgi:hypothetical protein